MKAIDEEAVEILKSVKTVDDFIDVVNTSNPLKEAKVDVKGYSLSVNELLSRADNIKKYSDGRSDCYLFSDKTSCVNKGGDLLRSIAIIGDEEHQTMFQII